jgi:aspartokinase/homoserine dehydrogenase 1
MRNLFRIALFGAGTIGRALIKRTYNDPRFRYVAVGDSSGVIANIDGFSERGLSEIIRLKEEGGHLKEFQGHHAFHEDMLNVLELCDADVLVDVTNAQTYDLLIKALEYTDILSSNKIPFADSPYKKFRKLVVKAVEMDRILDFGTTVGAGLKILDLIKKIGIDGIDHANGCLSGTMNYLSQKLNEDVPLSTALKEAMSPPRSYTEPDPRDDLTGNDFARKLTIIGRLCGRKVERSMVEIETVVTDELRKLSVEEFLEALPTLDHDIRRRAEDAKWDGKRIWYLGAADFHNDEYQVGFKEIPVGDPITMAKESDNVLTIFPRLWRRPVTIIGPGAGTQETVTGLVSGLMSF